MAKNRAIVFRKISELLTLKGAAQKHARHIVLEDLDVIEKGALVIEGERIVWTGEDRNLPKKYAALAREDRDLRGHCVLPALIECHTHMVFAGNRAPEFEMRNQGMSYQEIARQGGGILATLVPTREASLQKLTELAQEREEVFLGQGVATIEIKSGYGLRTETEFKMLKAARNLKRARIVATFLGAHAIPKERSSASAYIDYLIADSLPKLKKQGLAQRVDIFVEEGYFNEALADRYLQKAHEMGFALTIHADQLTHSGGSRLAVKYGARSADHLLQIDATDIKRLAASEVTCVLLPTSDLYMKCPYPPARELLDQGARVALATDFNPGTSPSQDVATTGVLARVQMKMTLPEVLVAATLGGAYALGLEADLGSLEVGKSADFAAFHGSWRELFYGIGGLKAAQLWRSGRRQI